MSQGIVFQVETARVLQILAREIYDSPLALIRENTQNAYDAIRMRFASNGQLREGGRIDIVVTPQAIAISDNGIGMTETTLRENFWRAGSSGKRSDDARAAGVVGTFGIGAMANFGVCSKLIVETRADGCDEALRSVAVRDLIKIGEECISFERNVSARDVGTTITAELDGTQPISAEQATDYLRPYVGQLPVPVYVNGTLISNATSDLRLPLEGRPFSIISPAKQLTDGFCSGFYEVSADSNGQVFVKVSSISLGGNPIEGSILLLQNGGQLMGLRSYFGLAPIPAIGYFQFGGVANLAFLHPTAGREALSRESIDQVTRFLTLAEKAAAESLAVTNWATRNTAFMGWISAHGRLDLAGAITVSVLPGNEEVPLAKLKEFVGSKGVHYYTGADPDTLATFANEELYLVQVAQVNPRRNIQIQYLTSVLNIPIVPDSAQVTKIFGATELSHAEAAIALRLASILRDDYLIPDVDVALSLITHRVSVLAEQRNGALKLYIAKNGALLPPLIECYNTAYELFSQFMKDFVRVHVYPRVQQYVPSSTRDGVDALRRILQRNRELYRYEEAEFGALEGVLGDLLSGTSSFKEVLDTARATVKVQSQSVTAEQVGSIEAIVPDVVAAPAVQTREAGTEFEPSPPIVRDSIASDMKILVTGQKYGSLNNFSMLLGVSDRLMRSEADFFLAPHTTRILWGGHRVVYIFTEATGRLSLYYDIELRNQIEKSKTGGGMFPTTTLITKQRVFIPVPDALIEEFKIASGAKEFFVRFDLLSSETG